MKEKGRGLDVRSSWLYLTEIGAIYIIHLREVGHVTQKDVDFHSLVERRPSRLQHSRQVLDALMLRSSQSRFRVF